jgi:hypothetical protein
MRPIAEFVFALGLATFMGGQVFAASNVKFISEKPGPPPAGLLQQYPAVVTHTHNWRFSAGDPRNDFDETEKKLVDWCAHLGIRAIGIGSPWDPATDAMYQRYEGPDRDLYYSDKFDPKSLMQTEHIQGILSYLNRMSGGKTYFYLDNETPKGRMSHVWWFGYSYDFPAWHDYSQDRPIRFYRDDPSIEINALTGEPHTRRNLFEIMATQRRDGALGVFAHPTRWWLNKDKFITNIAAMSGLFLLVDGYLDGLTIMGDRPYNKAYQDLWFHFLDTGAKVPGFAETDFALNKVSTRTRTETFRNYLHLKNSPITAENIRDTARTGDLFASNGVFLSISLDGVPMGSVCFTEPGKTHRLRIEAYPEEGSRFSRIELIGTHGAVLAAKRDFTGGVLEYEIAGSAKPGYIVVRAFGPGDDPDGTPEAVKSVAVSNPVYLHPRGFHVELAKTSCTLHVPAGSRWMGGSIEFQQADGRPIDRRTVSSGAIHLTLPASARILLRKAGQKDWMFYIAMENRQVEELLTYLIDGGFRKDYPNLHRDEVPPQAFHLPELKKALAAFDYEIK